MVLVEKWPFFQLFFFRQYRPGKCLLRYSRAKKTLLQPLKIRRLKSRRIDIFSKGLTHAFGPNMAIFQTFFFQAIEARIMSFTIFYSEKTPFQAIKTRNAKRRKIDIFPQRLTHGFPPKWRFFQHLFQAIQARKMSFTIFESKKTPFQSIKTTSSKSRKSDIFSQGVNPWFWSKRQYRPGKCLL